MPLVDLTDEERDVVYQCLCCISSGSVIPDWEFHTLFGVEFVELQKIVARWPDLDDSDIVTRLAINNSMNNLLGYPHEMAVEEWSQHISVSKPEVARIFRKWRGDSSSSYFDGLM